MGGLPWDVAARDLPVPKAISQRRAALGIPQATPRAQEAPPQAAKRGQGQACGDGQTAPDTQDQSTKRSKSVYNIISTQGWQSQAHVKWDCKYHVVILPKYRRKVLYGRIRRGIGQILRDLCRQKDIELVEGKAMPDHIHMLLSVPPRYSVAMAIGYLKGKSATRIHRELLDTKGTMFGRSFWARGYCVSTVGLDEDQIRRYIRDQEKLQQDRDQGELNFE